MIRFTLPVHPIPLSACFNNAARNGRYATPRYKAWQAECEEYVRNNYPNILGRGQAKFIGKVSVSYVISRKDERKRDLGNLEKCLSDFLVKMLIISDDSEIWNLNLQWSLLADSQWPVIVTVKELGT